MPPAPRRPRVDAPAGSCGIRVTAPTVLLITLTTMRYHLLTALLPLFATTSATAQTWSFPLDPRATFLRTENDPALPPLIVDLNALGVAPGSWVEIGTSGAYQWRGGVPDDYRYLVAVFSANSQLLASTVQQRVPGAIAAGPAYGSGATYYGNLPTDLAEDFVCSRDQWGERTVVQVPAGATHLFLGALDSYYSDNSDPNQDYVAVLRIVAPPTSPGTGEHLHLLGSATGQPVAAPDVHLAAGGTTLRCELHYPLGYVDGSLWLLAAEVVGTAQTLPQPLPRIWLSTPVIVASGALPGTPNWSASFQLPVPNGLQGLSVLVQGAALTPRSRNGIYQTTNVQRFDLQ